MLPSPDNQQFYPLILSQKLSIMAILLSKPRNFSLFLLCISSQVFFLFYGIGPYGFSVGYTQ